ncbi:MAG: putative phytoene synthase CrtB-like [Herminiimonas sp.]|nr:putative phytoene synthase CrtB-like [Herminiimonas sp.]
MSIDHYENFPVASILLPAGLRAPVEAIYRFARSADDIADEGDATPSERLLALKAYSEQLDVIESGAMPQQPLFCELATCIRQFNIPLQPLRDLLSAFSQDVNTLRYERYHDLLDYCSRSANPVGRLMLHLYGAGNEPNIAASDAICSALQLINFWQDVAVDATKGRTYLPQEDLRRFGVDEEQIRLGICDDNWRALMQFEADRARSLMQTGSALALRLPGRVGWELRLVVQGGLRILEMLEAARFDVFLHRPVLGKLDWVRLAWRAVRMPANGLALPLAN